MWRLGSKSPISLSLRLQDTVSACNVHQLPCPRANIVTDVEGFCKAEPEKPFGVKLDAKLGASLGLQGYTELKGDKDVFLDLTIFETPALYTFPQLCLAFGKQSPGACIPEQHTFDPIDSYLPGVDDSDGEEADEEAGVSKRSVTLVKRDERSANDYRAPYYLDCDTEKDFSIRGQNYQGPSKLKQKQYKVPIMKPGMSCAEAESETCPAKQWTIDALPDDATDNDRAVVTDKWACMSILLMTFFDMNPEWLTIFQRSIYTRGTGSAISSRR